MEMARLGLVASGVELNYWLILYSRLQARRAALHKSTYFHRTDLFKHSLAPYNVVVMFGTESLMDLVLAKADRECPVGASLLACRFPLPIQSHSPWDLKATVGEGMDTVWHYQRTAANPDHSPVQ